MRVTVFGAGAIGGYLAARLASAGAVDLEIAWQEWQVAQNAQLRAVRLLSLTGARKGEIVPQKSFRQALSQIVIADVSMSLDNVLAVAGTARHHLWVLVVGLALSVALMGLAATLIARLLNRHRWIAYLGLILIAWVAVAMIWDGAREVMHAVDSGLI